MLYDIIFDFSVSPVGGGLKRLLEYIKYFDQSQAKVLFLVHPRTCEILKGYKNVHIDYVSRSIVKRLLFDSSYVSRYRDKSKCFFSYGIPIYQRMSNLDWFHLSNTLPFAYKKCSVSRVSKLKNFLLFRMFKKGASNPDIVSAESQFSLDLYSSRCGKPKESIILRNGVDSIHFNNESIPERLPTVLTVGVEGYKRIVKVFNEFLNMRKTMGIEKLIIVGPLKKVPKYIVQTDGVRVTGQIAKEEITPLYSTSQFYISASEIENSSNAVIEAVAGGATCILSKIPSHLEMFDYDENLYCNYDIGEEFFVADATHLKSKQKQMWKEIIEIMLDRIKMPLKTKEF